MVTTRASRLSNPLLAVAITLVVIAAGCAGWFGWSWYRSAHSTSVATARVRDEVLQEGVQAVQDFNTLDYRHLSQGLALWQKSASGGLLREITAGKAQFEAAVSKAKTVTTASILGAAVTALNQQAGTAEIIVALQITVTPSTGSATSKRTRLEAALARTDTGWKLSALGQVPVDTTAPTAGPSTSP